MEAKPAPSRGGKSDNRQRTKDCAKRAESLERENDNANKNENKTAKSGDINQKGNKKPVGQGNKSEIGQKRSEVKENQEEKEKQKGTKNAVNVRSVMLQQKSNGWQIASKLRL